MNSPDILRTLDCWLWRIDPTTGRVTTVGGNSPFGPNATGWRPILRLCDIDARQAVLDALRRLRASDADGSLRVDGIGIPAAAGQRHLVDLVIGRQHHGAGAETWAGIVFRRWPAISASAPPTPAPAGTGPDRDSLVRELHHRIKNHLQGLTGLIERHRSDHPGLGEALDAIGGQLHSIGTVYGLLARSGRADPGLDEIAQAVTDGLAGIAANGIAIDLPESPCRCRIAEQHCVAIALVVNELLMNAIKHGGALAGSPPVRVSCEPLADGCRLRIRNEGRLPDGFDFDAGSGARTGLQLVRAMLPALGARLQIRAADGQVEVSLALGAPVLSGPFRAAGESSHHKGILENGRKG